MKKNPNPAAFRSHFALRAGRYNASASWVCDRALIAKIITAAKPLKTSVALDLAVGTGKIAAALKNRVRTVIGLDACPEMSAGSLKSVDCLVTARAQNMPFPADTFDICTCRQGLQFMDLEPTLAEIRRVLKPVGRAVSCHLTSYGGSDDAASFLIQKFRNPARKNFFAPGDLGRAARGFFSVTRGLVYITRESVRNWTSNGAISARAQQKIFRVYQGAPDSFRATHKLLFQNGDIFDSMRMEIVTAVKRK